MSAGAAISQTADSTVTNNQIQLGDVFATQTLDVVSSSDQTTATTTATGNAFSGAVETGSVDVQSRQQMDGDATASTTLNGTGNIGLAVSLTTAATGNTGDAESLGAGALTGSFAQSTNVVSIAADSQVSAASAIAGDVSANSQAFANSQGLGVTGGSIDASVTQTSQATVQATGGGNVMYTPGTLTFTGTAVANNISTSGTDSTQSITASQLMTGASTQAYQQVGVGNAQTVTAAATATGNNFSAANQGANLNVVVEQENDSYTRAEAQLGSYEFGTSSAQAFGVGNSVLASNTGEQISLDNTQINIGGGIESIANSSGTDGYDISSSATAMGNAVTGFACTTCGGRMTIGNSQTNNANIGATSSLTVDGSARSSVGTATAVGNSATFYVSSPGG